MQPQPSPGSPLRVFLNSWGPDDDGKTVDGPHQLGKVTELQADFVGSRTPSSFSSYNYCRLLPPTAPFAMPASSGKDAPNLEEGSVGDTGS